MLEVAVECFAPNSFFIGVPESMLGRVMHCLAGKRCLLGMKFDELFKSYQETFAEDCVDLQVHSRSAAVAVVS